MGFGGKSSTDNIDAYLIFHLKLRASNLLVAPYTEYQQVLFVTINDLREKGWNYRQIAYWLNQNDYKTPRGKMFHGSHVHSIVKKKRVREEKGKKKRYNFASIWACIFNILAEEKTEKRPKKHRKETKEGNG